MTDSTKIKQIKSNFSLYVSLWETHDELVNTIDNIQALLNCKEVPSDSLLKKYNIDLFLPLEEIISNNEPKITVEINKFKFLYKKYQSSIIKLDYEKLRLATYVVDDKYDTNDFLSNIKSGYSILLSDASFFEKYTLIFSILIPLLHSTDWIVKTYNNEDNVLYRKKIHYKLPSKIDSEEAERFILQLINEKIVELYKNQILNIVRGTLDSNKLIDIYYKVKSMNL
jgi:hypothetical protein